MKTLSSKIKKRSIATLDKPLWEGPSGKGRNGGITFSLIKSYLCCKERFRLKSIEGLRTIDAFDHKIEFGNMWHTCEEEFARTKGSDDNWQRALIQYVKQLCTKYRTQQPEIIRWMEICQMQFPLYKKFWSKHLDKSCKPLFQEQVFDVPITLPSGRIVRLRGKWDSGDVSQNPLGIVLQENKTKGEIDQQQIRQQLRSDLQTMTYLVALQQWLKNPPPEFSKKLVTKRIIGIRYNCIRRPLSGGKGSIRQKKPTKTNPTGESKDDYYGRLLQYIKDEPESYFMRWRCDVCQADINEFAQRTLYPLLESICDWYEWIAIDPTNPWRKGNKLHWQHPFGAENPIDKYGRTDLDECVMVGSKVGLHKVETLFGELEE